jgi:hypothetical protein
MALKCDVTPARLVFRSRHPRRPGHHIREFGLVGFQDRLAVEPDRDPGAGALDLDRVPLGSRPRRFGGRVLVPIIHRASFDTRASVLSRAMSGRQGRCPRAGFQYTRFVAWEGIQPRPFRVRCRAETRGSVRKHRPSRCCRRKRYGTNCAGVSDAGFPDTRHFHRVPMPHDPPEGLPR